MSSTDKESKSILAVQSFVDQTTDDQIMAICAELQKVEGYSSDLGGQFVPHITLASWKVTREELQVAASQFESRLSDLTTIKVALALDEQHRNDTLSYFLIPEASEPLLQFHAQVHNKLGWRFEPFRQFDLPGSWLPHLSLFDIPHTQKPLIGQSLQKFREIPAATIERIGLVSFLGSTRVIGEVKLKKVEASR